MYWITSLEGGPRRVNHAAAVVGNYIYSFGGYCTGEDSKKFCPMDVHVLNIETLRWTRIPLAEFDSMYMPYRRYGHTAVAYGKKIFIWGGRNDELACNILYYFDTATNHWGSPDVKGIIPSARDGHSACLNGHQMYIFGGFEENEEAFSQEVYMLDLKEYCWSYVSTLGTPPSFRDFHTAVVLRNRMYIFGGRGDSNYPTINTEEIYSSQLIYLDFETGRWHTPYTCGDEPIGRRSHSAFMHNGSMYIFGGFNGNIDKHFNEIYEFNPYRSEWKKMKTLGNSPCERRRQSCIVLSDRMYLFGGTSPNGKPRRNSLSSDDDDEDQTANLMDHSDLYVLDFNPTLRTLSMLAVIQNKLEINRLPAFLQYEIEMMITANTITSPLDSNFEELKIQ